ncbi:MAG: hypothetical protein HKUEN01_32260 [Candidatus Kuenenia stuttgartiensis]|nr:MAG: hypothetical protein HKUEN01_32260 [Candidatus Kuenenia stuttgartiensis]
MATTNPYALVSKETLAARARAKAAGYTDAEISAYEAKRFGTAQAQPAKKFSIADLAPVGGSIIGGLVGALAGPAGMVAGGAAGAAAGEAFRQKKKGEEFNLGKVVKEGLISGALDLATLGAGKLVRAGKAAKAGIEGAQVAKTTLPTSEKIANRISSTGLGLGKKTLTNVNATENTAKVAKYFGFPVKTADAERALMEKVAGEGSELAKIYRSTIASIKTPINIDPVYKRLSGLALDSGFKPKQIKEIREEVRAILPPNLGSLRGDVAYDVTKSLEKRAFSEFAAGSNPLNPSAYEHQLRGKLFLELADEIEGELVKQASKSGGVAKVLTPESVESIRRISPRLADELVEAASKPNSLKEVRSLRAPFVQRSRLLQESSINDMARSSNPIAAATIGGGTGLALGGPLGGVTGLLASPIISSIMNASRRPLTQVVAKATSGAGKATRAVKPTLSRAAIQTLGRTGTGQLDLSGVGAVDPTMSGATDPMTEEITEEAVTEKPQLTRDDIVKLIILDLAKTGGKNVGTLTTIAGLMGVETKPTVQNEAQISRASAIKLIASALSDIETKPIKTGAICGIIESGRKKLSIADQDTIEFNNKISALKANIAKARAGNSFTEGEKKLLEAYTPSVGDSKQELISKLRTLQAEFGS